MKKSNNRGISLIELIIGMAISSIIIAAIILFMSAGSRGYQAAQSEISLQTEAQTIMNQIREYVLEGNNIEYDSGNAALTIYHSDGNAATTTDAMEIIWFNGSDHNMYLYHTTAGGKTSVMAAVQSGTVTEDNLMGEYVEGFEVSGKLIDDRTGASGTTLTVSLRMKYNGREYKLAEDMKLRNRIVNIP
ncbi:prepilin-type N-terminal cleavage/methylation domain-containing protein [Anaerocolumna xylanovorans]|uniref:Prepilin-type N-terminal cleavage/methylation domain-containing protein n=1 Tax=Anaerocolumna xylanovorans DSM 12503 TaxID=1121345 RepID=A0A1M7YMP1_9FIRM|nr:prepilin-type N-terminal cleavage/methylation domain-containing protein [Anaerocolumna xylanovorans]SHO53933.1 prepilin-type N-terminal cleavage/methylation domain-containing protein [Anaerocolumna xylanovorans DSM 12503]